VGLILDTDVLIRAAKQTVELDFTLMSPLRPHARGSGRSVRMTAVALFDKQMGATALTHGLALVTRNTAHFSALGMTLVNPFV